MSSTSNHNLTNIYIWVKSVENKSNSNAETTDCNEKEKSALENGHRSNPKQTVVLAKTLNRFTERLWQVNP
jgi:hypothetical protein